MSDIDKARLKVDDGGPTVGLDKPDAEFIASMREGVTPEKDSVATTPPEATPKIATPKVDDTPTAPPKVDAPSAEPKVDVSGKVEPKVDAPPTPSVMQEVLTKLVATQEQLAKAVAPKEEPKKKEEEKPFDPDTLLEITEEEGDSILAGGQMAAKALKQVQMRTMNVMANLTMAAIQQLMKTHVEPLQQLQRARVAEETKARFFGKHQDLKGWEQECYQIGQATMGHVRDGSLKFNSEEEFHDYIATEARKLQSVMRERLGASAAPAGSNGSGGVKPPPPPTGAAPRRSTPQGEEGLSEEQKEMRRLAKEAGL